MATLAQPDLENLFHDAITGITGLDPTLVRPRWQRVPPQQPDWTVNWCAFGITRRESQDFPWFIHTETDPLGGPDLLFVPSRIEVLCSFFGPNGEDLAGQLRDGLYLPQNTEPLLPYGIRLYEGSDLLAVPDLENEQWVNRYDITLRFAWTVVRAYQVHDIISSEGTIVGADGTILGDPGITRTWDVEPPKS